MILSHLASTMKRSESQKTQRKLLKILYETKKSHLQLMIYVKQLKLKQMNKQRLYHQKVCKKNWKWAIKNEPISL